MAAVPLPSSGATVVVAPRRHLDALVDAVLPLRDIALESDAFSRSWQVRAADQAVAVAVLTPAVQLALQDRPGTWGWSFETAC